MGAARRFPLVLHETFIQATRDTGYRSTASAVAELVDNALQARAKKVRIFIEPEPHSGDDLAVSVLDDGQGMDAATLRRAMQFGGSSRFNDRNGTGRFGMGLPNASVSQARRIDVYTWRAPNYVLNCHLDVDEVSAGGVDEVPPVRRSTLPSWTAPHRGFSGTLVRWTRCDRLDNRRISTITRKLHEPLGRMFRYFLWNGAGITVNGDPVQPIDPLFLHPTSPLEGAAALGEPLMFEVRCPQHGDRTSMVRARFAVLPVEKWHDLPLEEKRRLRVVGGAGMSVLRANREVDYGWFFFGGKRRENYDDWWRCELSFEPDLDELFGVTHSKQSINPTGVIREVLTPDMESVARMLNGRIQDAFQRVKARPQPSPAIRVAAKQDHLLPPLPPRPAPSRGAAAAPKSAVADHKKGGADETEPISARAKAGQEYAIEVRSTRSPAFYECALRDGVVQLVINSDHPFYKVIYQPTMAKNSSVSRHDLECMLLAIARAEAEAGTPTQRHWYRQKRMAWSDALAAFLERRK
jgi:hypothetical protein